jgi:hypothetical protein
VADISTDHDQLLVKADLNPIQDGGCPRSAGGLDSVASICTALGISVKLTPLDCDPFFHGYGENCADSRIAIGIWNLFLTDLSGFSLKIPFYIFQGTGPLLIGNSILKYSDVRGPENLLVVTPSAGLSASDLALQTYTTSALRTQLHDLPCRRDHLKTFFSSVTAFHSSALSSRSKPSNARDCS